MKKYTEKELINCLRSKDKSAFSFLYDSYSGALNGIILRIIKDKEISEDVLEEVFIKIWNNFSNFDCTKGSLFSWLIITAKNTAINYLKSQPDKIKLSNYDFENVIINTPFLNLPIDCVDEIQLKNQASKLKSLKCSIIHKFYFEGYNHVQISNETGLPLDTVKTIIRSGFSVLSNSLQVTAI